MNKTLEKLKNELEAAQRALAEAEERFALQESADRPDAKEAKNSGKRRQTDKMLRESEIQYRRLFESAQDGILILDAQSGRILDANPFILDLLSYRLDELKGKTLWEIGLFKDIEASKAAFEALQSDGYIRYEDLPLETKEGRQIKVEFVSNIYDVGDRKVIQCNIRDMTATLRAKKLFTASHDLLRNVLENIPVRVFWKDTELRYLGCNTAFAHDAGLSRPEELIGKDDFEMAWREQAELYRADDKKVMQSGIPVLGHEEPQTTPDGKTIWLRTSKVPLRAADGEIFAMLGIYEDITEDKLSNEQTQLFRTLLDNSTVCIEVIEPDTMRFLDVNETECRELGYSREEMLSMGPADIDPAFTPKVSEELQSQLRKTGSARFETVHRRKDGSTYPVECSMKAIELDKPYVLNIVRDITERKHAEAALQDSEARMRAIFNGALDGIALLDLESGVFIEANSALLRMLGYSPEEFARLKVADIHPKKDLPSVLEQFNKQVRGEIDPPAGLPVKRKDGSVFYADINSATVTLGGSAFIVGVIRDITERKQAEATIKRTNRALRTLSAGNLALVRAESEDELLQSVTDVIVEQAGYIEAAVDYAGDDTEKSIIPRAWSGYEGDHYWVEHLTWADTAQGQLPVSKAIRTGKTEVCHDIAGETAFTPWRASIVKRGYVSNIALPLSDGGRTFGALSIYASESNAFDDEEIRLLEELASDLAYGILTLRSRKAIKKHSAILQQSLEQSIQTIAATVEARDPYTAGHQQRVGDLSRAIAREMSLPEEQVNAVYLAAIIHDLGKIHIPAEILSKPGALSDIEYKLVQEHPRAGYDILKDIQFPWPIAEIILQHHERVDGTGYPQGLKGDTILLEAKIIAVADTVEAMSSHRPYRPGLGLEPALAEIKKERGTHFDPAVVDACITLFEVRGYHIPD